MNVYLSYKLKVLSFIRSTDVNYIFDNSAFLQYFITEGVARIAVPIFFMISGYLFFITYENTKANYKQKLKKRFNSLFIPYILASLLYFVLIINPFTSKYLSSSKYLLDMTFGNKVLHAFLLNPPGHLWFLKDLLVLVLITPIIYQMIKHLKFYFILILLFLWFPILPFDFYIFKNEAILFFSFGAYLTTKRDFFAKKRKGYIYYLTTFTWILILTIKSLLNIKFGFHNEIAYILLKFSIIIGVISVWALYDICMKKDVSPNRFLLNIAQYSFFIYLAHAPIILNTLKKISIFFIEKNQLLLPFFYFFNAIITIILCIIIAKGLQKYTPKLYSIITGGR